MKNIVILIKNRWLQGSKFPINLEYISEYCKDNLHLICDSIEIYNDIANHKRLSSITLLPELTIDAVNENVKKIIPNNEEIYFFAPTEFTMIICGELRKKQGLIKEGYERFINKIEMKKRLLSTEINFPKYVAFDKQRYLINGKEYLKEIAKDMQLPFFVKPIDEANCKGSQKIETFQKFTKWASIAVTTPYKFEIDEYIDGVLYHSDLIIKDSKIIFAEVFECIATCYDFLLGKVKGSIPISLNITKRSRLKNFAEKALITLGIPENGVVHLEIIESSKTGELFFLEAAYRHPGLLIPKVYEKQFGFRIIDTNFLLQMCPNFEFKTQKGPYSCWLAYPKYPGIVKSINPIKICSKYELTLNVSIGEKITITENGRDYSAMILLWNDDYQKLHEDYLYLYKYELISMMS